MSERARGGLTGKPVTAREKPMQHVTPYDRFAQREAQIEEFLAIGRQQAELTAYFGATEYRELAQLARRARSTKMLRGAPRVLVVPGIMGSQLGLRRAPPQPDDIVWLDPVDIRLERLAALRLPAKAPIVSLGIVLFSYLRMKLYLRARGFSVETHDYDWRLPLSELGRGLARRLEAQRGPVALVAHSMGGLVARAALAHPGGTRVAQVVLLGTPNLGSFAAVQALRGTYAVVRKIARLAQHTDAEALAAGVFSTFPSLYELLPWMPGMRADLFARASWPRRGPQPHEALLRAARAARDALAPLDERCTLIAGVGQETVTAIARRGDDFLYTITRHGDGTVPVASAAPDGTRALYAQVAHSDLTRDAHVAETIVDLLRDGSSGRLPALWHTRSRASAHLSDAALRRTHTQKVNWPALGSEERRLYLENLNEPPRVQLRVVPSGARRTPRRKP